MDFQAVKGTRDFYPDEMRLRNWIVDAWRRVSLRNGFEEYDSPIFEYLDLFTAKSGQEIAGQLFSFTDRGGRSLAIRPEITPALARMVNARVNALPRPIKWFSAPRLCRAENPQKGRLREFFQWNIDVIGSDDTLADAECIFTAVDFLREVGLAPTDVQVRIGSRPLTVAALKASGVTDDKIDPALAVLDKRAKIEDAEFVRLAKAAGLSDSQIDSARRFQDCPACADVGNLLEGVEGVAAAVANLQELLSRLSVMGAAEYCKLDLGVVRGLAYYTGVVYEVFDAGQSLRAIAGGGRYDNLLQVLGGPALGATGFGMGDVVLGILLAEKGKLPALGGQLDFFVIDAEGTFEKALAVVGALRGKGLSADFSYKRQAIGKQFKQASQRGAKFAAIIEPDGGVTVKDLTAGTQTKRGLDEFLAEPVARAKQ